MYQVAQGTSDVSRSHSGDDLLKRLEQLNRIGIALSQEKDITRLLEAILIAAQEITRADGGTLYRMTEEKTLKFEIMRNGTLGIAMGGTSGVEIPFYPIHLYDKEGQLVSGSFMDYSMPHAEHFPTLKVGTTTTKCPSNPLGIKGCGEAGAIAAPAAVINAITDAIGTEDLAMPATAPAVWAAIRKAAKMQQAAE